MFRHLLANAVKFSARHGQVVVLIRSLGHDLAVSVCDTGAGIDEETMPRIFEPFFTTKEVGEGTGLGLAAVQGIIRNHEGVVAIESLPGIGTSFSIYLPTIDGAAVPSREQKPTALAVAGKDHISAYPQLPSMKDVGHPDVDVDLWFGVMAPAGTAAATVQALNEVFAKATNAPELTERFKQLGVEIATGSPAQFKQAIESENARLGPFVKELTARK